MLKGVGSLMDKIDRLEREGRREREALERKNGQLIGALEDAVKANERLRAELAEQIDAASALGDTVGTLSAKCRGLQAHLEDYQDDVEARDCRIEAALTIPGKVREEMASPLWPSLTPDELLAKVEEMLIEAFKGEGKR